VDHYLAVAFDLSKVMFIVTANILDTIPPALRDRLEIIRLPGYSPAEKVEIARRHLIPNQLEAHGLTRKDISFTRDALGRIITDYTAEAGVRNLERQIGAVCRKIAVRISKGGRRKKARISPKDLSEHLGPQRVFSQTAERVSVPGVTVGLAWTPAGGEILFIESTRMPGKGQVTLTGQLGDVMRESVMTARSLLRSRAKSLGLGKVDFGKEDLHVHIPAGAVPKDGPSAGSAVYASLVSLYTGRPARSDTAMTGEVTLRGKVLPIGGVKEKVLAAKRAGIKRVIMPELNRNDLEEVAAEHREGVEIHFVKTVDELVKLIFADGPGKRARRPVGRKRKKPARKAARKPAKRSRPKKRRRARASK
jgi:ATP-dependent Lon protease